MKFLTEEQFEEMNPVFIEIFVDEGCNKIEVYQADDCIIFKTEFDYNVE